MTDFTLHALHNEEFHSATTEKFPDKFYDWKVVMVFYAGMHYVKGLAKQKNINIGESHKDIRQNIKPISGNGQYSPAMPFTKTAYNNYDLLYEASRNARYTGFKNIVLFEEIMKEQNKTCLEALGQLKAYLKDRGLTL